MINILKLHIGQCFKYGIEIMYLDFNWLCGHLLKVVRNTRRQEFRIEILFGLIKIN